MHGIMVSLFSISNSSVINSLSLYIDYSYIISCYLCYRSVFSPYFNVMRSFKCHNLATHLEINFSFINTTLFCHACARNA